ncbi:MAG: insulinase family protein [Bacteroidia bacterium]|jgi:zinc protease
MKTYLLLIAIWIFPLTILAQEVPTAELEKIIETSPEVKTGKLENGLTYYIIKNKKPENRMELRLAVNAGATSEEDNQQGLAHFVEHMAFNGTRHFKKNELVNYLESIGTKFGPHLNAYTSFDETVYMMQVPTDSATQFDKAFLILEDWAHGITFDSNEVNKERGVVIEEWRLGQGALERMRNEYWPMLFTGSRYGHRLPIGQKNVLETAPASLLKSFYKDWYRPELMAVVAIGDFDVEVVEQKIITHFSKLKNPAKPRALTAWDVLETPNLQVATVKDKEAPYSIVQVIYKLPKTELKTEGDYRRIMLERIFNGMMASRLDELTHKPDAPFNYASIRYGELVRYKNSYSAFAIVNEKNIMKGLTALVDESERVNRFGFNASEFDRQVIQMQRQLEKQMNESDKTESARLAGKVVSSYLKGTALLNVQKEFELFSKYIGTIRVEEINQFCREWVSEPTKNCLVILQTPDKPTIKIPEHSDIMDVVREVSKRDIHPYQDFASNTPLIQTNPVPGKIVAEKKDGENAITEWKLSNGATVAFKKTDFKNDEIQLRAFSWGGASLYPLGDDASASEAASIVSNSGVGQLNYNDLNKYMKGKIANVRPYISETSEGMSGSSSLQDFETMMQLVHLYFTAPRNDTAGFKSYMERQRAFIENRSLDPESAYEDTIEVTMSNYHPRRRPWTLGLLNEVKQKRAFELYRERFANAADFTFTFVGNVDESILKNMVMQYLATLPGNASKEKWEDVGVTTPKGKISKTVKRGMEAKSTVTMRFTGDAKFDPKANMDMKVLMKLMSIKLRESLREENSGTYGVSCYGGLMRIPRQEFYVNVSFGCAPGNIDRLTKAALKVIDRVMEEGCDEQDLIKIKETFRREREVSLKDNNWWLSTINQYYAMNDPIPSQKEFEEYFNNLKSEDFKAAAKKYFVKDNYAYFTWVPAESK